MIEDKTAYIEDLKKRFSDESGSIDVNKLLEAKAEADITVIQRTREATEVREDLQSRLTLEEILSKLDSAKTASQVSQTSELESRGPVEIAKSEVESFVLEAYNKQKQKEAQEANQRKVDEELSKAWGLSAPDKLLAKAKELGVSKDFIDNLAKTQPNVLLKLVLDEQKTVQPNVAPPRSSMNTSAQTNTGGMKDYSYWQKVRKENPSYYHSIEGTNERHKMAMALGESFYNK